MLGRRKNSELEKLLGHRFKDEDLLRRALTHSSVAGARSGRGKSSPGRDGDGNISDAVADNERLEFLGDRVLGLVVAEMLAELFPKAREGELARRFNQLVRGETCTQVAKDLDLGRFIRLHGNELGLGGRGHDSILADAMEALLAAVFLDAGYEKSRKVIRRFWMPYSEREPEVTLDPKTALQEWAQGERKVLPAYSEVSRSGPDHAPIFIAQVAVDGFDPAQGQGGSKRIAEQNAAEAFLVREGMWPTNEDTAD